MTNKEKAVRAFQEFFGIGANTEKFEDVKGTDSRIFRVSGIGVDQTIMEVTESGIVAVEDGDVTLDDGTIVTVASGIITNVQEPKDEPVDGETTSEDMSKVKLFSKTEKQNFTIIKEVSIWETEVDNTSFELGEKVTYTYEDVQYAVCDGQYELEDGTKIFVDAEGIIVMKIMPDGTVEAPVADEPSGEVAPADEQMSKEDDVDKQIFENIEKLISDFSALKAENEALKTKVEKLGKMPSANPTETKVNFAKDSNKNENTSVLHSLLKLRD